VDRPDDGRGFDTVGVAVRVLGRVSGVLEHPTLRLDEIDEMRSVEFIVTVLRRSPSRMRSEDLKVDETRVPGRTRPSDEFLVTNVRPQREHSLPSEPLARFSQTAERCQARRRPNLPTASSRAGTRAPSGGRLALPRRGGGGARRRARAPLA